jgi:hypothetical protein
VIKAIETVYNGYRFRSRTEARWAVFFDALGIKYEYEAEGYDLGALGWYLPDFWLPDAGWHIEVKPANVYSKELERAQYFDNYPPEGSLGIIFLFGQPEMPNDVFIEYEDGRMNVNWDNHAIYISIKVAGIDIFDVSDTAKLIKAVKAARQARFEYGETPTVK